MSTWPHLVWTCSKVLGNTQGSNQELAVIASVLTIDNHFLLTNV
jgi:hypothetical protein